LSPIGREKIADAESLAPEDCAGMVKGDKVVVTCAFCSSRRVKRVGEEQGGATNWHDGQITSDFQKSCQARD